MVAIEKCGSSNKKFKYSKNDRRPSKLNGQFQADIAKIGRSAKDDRKPSVARRKGEPYPMSTNLKRHAQSAGAKKSISSKRRPGLSPKRMREIANFLDNAQWHTLSARVLCDLADELRDAADLIENPGTPPEELSGVRAVFDGENHPDSVAEQNLHPIALN